MRIASQKVNSVGVCISKSKVMEATERYIKKYNGVCELLYSMDYISVPTYFYEDEFWTAFIDENPEYMASFLDKHTGAMNFSLNQIEYLLLTMRHDKQKEDVCRVLSLAKEVLEAKQAIDDLNKLGSTVRFQKKSDVITVKSNLAVSVRVFNASKIPLDSSYVQECFYFEGKKVVKFDYSIEVLRTLLKALGVDDSVSLEDASVLLGDDFTIKDDCHFLDSIISGEIDGNGKYAGLLHKVVEEYYDNYYSTRTTIAECVRYSEQNFINSISSCIQAVKDYRTTLPEGYREVYVTSSEVWFMLDEPAPQLQSKSRDVYVGNYLFDYESHGTLGVVPCLAGFCGEYLYEFSPVVSEFTTQGMPVVIPRVTMKDGKEVLIKLKYYSILSLKRKASEGLAEVYPMTRIPAQNCMTENEMKEFLQVDSLDTLNDEVAELVEPTYKTHPEEYRQLVGLLVQTLVCMKCNYILEGRNSSNHLVIPEYSWLTEEIYLDACIEAEFMFKKIGF